MTFTRRTVSASLLTLGATSLAGAASGLAVIR